METSLSYSMRGETRERARFCYETSLSVWQPTPSDLALDDVLATYTQGLSLMGGGGDRRPRIYDRPSYDDDRSYISSSTARRSQHGRIQDPVYPGAYSGYSSVSRHPKAIEYLPRSGGGVSEIGSMRSGGGGHYSQRKVGGFEELRYVDEVRAKRPSRGREGEFGDDVSVGPEDSASNVSSQVSRGRSRRRESSMVARSMLKPGGGYGGQSMIYEDDEFEQSRGYMTKDITPYNMGGAR